jgi:hypothetical protein
MAVGKKRKEFGLILADVKLGRRNKMSLLRLVNDKTDLKRLKVTREQACRDTEEGKPRQGRNRALSRFLTGLKINQADKNAFIKRLGEGESVGVIRKDALALQQRVAAKGVSKERQFSERMPSSVWD